MTSPLPEQTVELHRVRGPLREQSVPLRSRRDEEPEESVSVCSLRDEIGNFPDNLTLRNDASDTVIVHLARLGRKAPSISLAGC